MPVILDRSTTPPVIDLQGEVNIRCAAELKDLLIQTLALAGPLHIDLSAIKEIDITAIQLLWAAEREARKAGKEFLFVGTIPEIILAIVNHAGLRLPLGAA
jgi:anti-anti-sigma regulatory factor